MMRLIHKGSQPRKISTPYQKKTPDHKNSTDDGNQNATPARS